MVLLLALATVSVFEPAELPHAIVGREYTGGPLMLRTGACAPNAVSWRVTEGELPPGITLSGAGYFSGAPKRAGRFAFEVRADRGCGTAEASFEIVVNPAAILTVRPPKVALAVEYGHAEKTQFTLQVASTEPGLAYSVESSGHTWLSTSTRAGEIPAAGGALVVDALYLDVDPSKLLPGVHRADVRLSAFRAANAITVPVTISVRTPVPETRTIPTKYALTLAPVPPMPVIPVAPPPPPPPPVVVHEQHTPTPEPHVQAPHPTKNPAAEPQRGYRTRRFAASRPVLPRKPAAGAHGKPAVDAHGKPVEKPKPAVDAHGKPVEKPKPAVDAHGKPVEKPKPAADAHGKPAEKPKPVADAHGKPVEKPKPAVDAHGKPAEKPKPAADAHAKPVEKPKPAADAHGKPAEKPKPAADAHAKPVEKPKPTADAHGKPAEKPKPVADAHSKPVEKPKPAADAHGKPVDKPKPAADAHAKPAEKPKPVAKEKPSPVGDKVMNRRVPVVAKPEH